MSPVPFGRRNRLTSDVGPDLSGSNPGFACAQMPEKSGRAACAFALPDRGRHNRRRKWEHKKEIPPLQTHSLLPCPSQVIPPDALV